jgi:phage shock protein PspC (stress-responsive transcriptional regulator)
MAEKFLKRRSKEKLIDQEVKKSGIKVTSKEVETTLEEVKKRNAATGSESGSPDSARRLSENTVWGGAQSWQRCPSCVVRLLFVLGFFLTGPGILIAYLIMAPAMSSFDVSLEESSKALEVALARVHVP